MRNTLKKISPFFLIALVLTLQGCLKSSNNDIKYTKFMFGNYFNSATDGIIINIDGGYTLTPNNPSFFDKAPVKNGDRVIIAAYDFTLDQSSKNYVGEIKGISKVAYYDIENITDETLDNDYIKKSSAGVLYEAVVDGYMPPYSSLTNHSLNFQITYKGRENSLKNVQLLYNNKSYKDESLTLYLNVTLDNGEEGEGAKPLQHRAEYCTFRFDHVLMQHPSIKKLIIKFKHTSQSITTLEYTQPQDTDIWLLSKVEE